MPTKKIFVTGMGVLICAILAFTTVMTAQAAGGTGILNDPFVIDGLPFSDSMDTWTTTTDTNGPVPSCAIPGSQLMANRWYIFTPGTNKTVRANLSTTNYTVSTELAVYAIDGNGSLSEYSCGSSGMMFTLNPGVQYYFLMSGYFWWGWDNWSIIGLSLEEVLPPANDNFADAEVISALPFSVRQDLTLAALENTESTSSCWGGESTGSAWFVFTPTTDNLLRISPWGSIAIYTGDSLNNLTQVACGAGVDYWNVFTYRPQAGTTYYFRTEWPNPWGAAGVDIEELLPPPNDAFANAEVITELPFYVNMDFIAATMELSEPTPSCLSGDLSGSAWYAFTPPTNASLLISTSGTIAVYTGNSIDNLTEVVCGNNWYAITFKPQAGTTLYIRAQTPFNLSLTPPLNVSLGYSPGDPAIYDMVTFYCNYMDWDWWYKGIQSIHWDFGDGSVADGSDAYASHTYRADGDYTVNITVNTNDGSSTPVSVVVPVRTHTVAITNFKVPEQIKAGAKHRFVVTIANTNYPESVEVELYKYTPAGFTLFAALVQEVPTGKTTDFNFDYTFSQKDETSGVVNSFQAVATLIGYRDAKPTDNEVTLGPQSGLKDWTVYAGQWGIVDSQMTNIPKSSGPDSSIWAGNHPLATQGDLKASFDIKLTMPDNYSGRNGGVMFFASTPTMREDANMNGYTIDWIDMWEGIRLIRWDHGQPVVLSILGAWELYNPPTHWTVEVEGQSIRFYGDGIRIFEAQDNTYRSGYFGFFAASNMTKIEVSNVQIANKFRSLIIK